VLHSPHAKTGRQLSAGQHVRPFGVISRLAHLAQLGEDASSSMVSVLCCAVLCCAVLCCAVLCCAVLCKLLHLAILSRQRHMPSCSRCPVYTYDRMERACAVSDDGARRCVLHSFLMAASQSWRSQCSLSMHCFHGTGPCLVSCEYLGHLNSDQKMSV